MSILGLETVVLLLLLVACLSAFIFRPLKLPYTVGLVAVGFALGHLERLGVPSAALRDVVLSPQLILYIFVPPLIFQSAINLDNRLLERNLVPILVLAAPGLMLSMFLIGGLIAWLTPLALGSALLFGALISATDPVAVIALFKEFGVARRLTLLLEGESMLNDATAIVAFEVVLFLVASEGAQTLAPGHVLGRVALVLLGGLVVGFLMGKLAGYALVLVKRDGLIQVTVSVIVAYMTFIVAEHYLHVSGVIAVMVAGLTVGRHASERITAAQRAFFKEFWEFAAFLANSLVFLLVGLSSVHLFGRIRAFEPGELGLAIGLAVGVAVIARVLVVFSLIPPLNRFLRDGPIGWRFQTVMAWGGLRGAVALALVLSLDEGFADRDLLLAMTLGVVLFTILVSGGTMGTLIHRLRLDTPEHIDRLLGAEARYLASRSAAEALAKLDEKEPFLPAVLDDSRRRLQDRLQQAEYALTEAWSAARSSPSFSRRALWSQAVALEHRGYQRLFDTGVVSEAVFKRLELLVDLKRESVRLDHIPPPVAAHEPLGTGWEGRLRSGFLDRRAATGERLEDLMQDGLGDLVRGQRHRRDLMVSYEYEFALFEVTGDVAEEVGRLARHHALDEDIAAGCVRAYQVLREQSLRRLRSAATDEPALVEELQASILRRHALSDAKKMLDRIVAEGLIASEIAAKTLASLE